MKPRILISACLLGRRVRYDAGECGLESDIIDRWQAEDRLVVVCPEVVGGLSTPRPPAEIEGGDGGDVLDGAAKVLTKAGVDVSAEFVAGARVALSLAQNNDVKVAVLKARSPSCGSGVIYDGSHSGQRRDGSGVTTALLERHGIRVFDEDQLEDADRVLRELRE